MDITVTSVTYGFDMDSAPEWLVHADLVLGDFTYLVSYRYGEHEYGAKDLSVLLFGNEQCGIESPLWDHITGMELENWVRSSALHPVWKRLEAARADAIDTVVGVKGSLNEVS